MHSDNIGIILAGGMGLRLHPITLTLNKHLLPVYNKPMIYYPISILMLAGIKRILLITDKESVKKFKKLFNNGKYLGIEISYIVQHKPNGIPEGLILAKKKIMNKKTILILGDNFFFGQNFPDELKKAINNNEDGCTFFTYNVSNPENYAVISSTKKKIIIEEKPKKPKSNLVIPGIYIFDNKASYYASKLKKSKRGELEIVYLIKMYLDKKKYICQKINRGVAWHDMGSFDDLLAASDLVQKYEERQNLMIGSVEEVAFRMGYIDKKKILQFSSKINNSYGNYLKKIINEK